MVLARGQTISIISPGLEMDQSSGDSGLRNWHSVIRDGTASAKALFAEIDQRRLGVDARSDHGYTLLMEAAHAKDLALIDGLLARRATVTSGSSNRASSLYWACCRSLTGGLNGDSGEDNRALQVMERLLAAWPGDADWPACAQQPLRAALHSRWSTCALRLLGLGAVFPDDWAFLAGMGHAAELVQLATAFRNQLTAAVLGSASLVSTPSAVGRMIAAYVI